MRSGVVSLLVLALVFAACGGSPVGGTCAQASDCPAGQRGGGTVAPVCLQGTSAPGGYCSLPCTTPGAQDDCPSGSLCTSLATGNYCAHICQAQSDCRTGYNCNGVTSASSSKTCQ